jgi:hypothetical protein
MLLTTEHAYKEANENMPNPERIDKVGPIAYTYIYNNPTK